MHIYIYILEKISKSLLWIPPMNTCKNPKFTAYIETTNLKLKLKLEVKTTFSYLPTPNSLGTHTHIFAYKTMFWWSTNHRDSHSRRLWELDEVLSSYVRRMTTRPQKKENSRWYREPPTCTDDVIKYHTSNIRQHTFCCFNFSFDKAVSVLESFLISSVSTENISNRITIFHARSNITCWGTIRIYYFPLPIFKKIATIIFCK